MKLDPNIRLVLVAFVSLYVSTLNLSGQNAITFYANISDENLKDIAGHVWIGLEAEGKRFTYGWYPVGIQDDSNREYDVSYSFKINVKTAEAVKQVIQNYKNKNYVFGLNDCRRMTQKAAEAAGLVAPDVGLKSPAAWLGELVNLNQ